MVGDSIDTAQKWVSKKKPGLLLMNGQTPNPINYDEYLKFMERLPLKFKETRLRLILGEQFPSDYHYNYLWYFCHCNLGLAMMNSGYFKKYSPIL
jgi:transposase